RTDLFDGEWTRLRSGPHSLCSLSEDVAPIKRICRAALVSVPCKDLQQSKENGHLETGCRTQVCSSGVELMDRTIWLGIVGLVLSALTIAAIYLGPIAALKIQRRLDDERESKRRKLEIFKVLMSNRATPLSPAYVQALNLIDVEFTGSN